MYDCMIVAMVAYLGVFVFSIKNKAQGAAAKLMSNFNDYIPKPCKSFNLSLASRV